MSTADPQPPETMPTTQRRLRTTVHVPTGDGYGAAEIFGPGDEVPEWAARLISNPKAWDTWTEPDVNDVYLLAQNPSLVASDKLRYYAEHGDTATAHIARVELATRPDAPIPPAPGPKTT